jgi:hypothetical protein
LELKFVGGPGYFLLMSDILVRIMTTTLK